MSYVALATVVIGAGTAAYSANQQSKAADKQEAAQKELTDASRMNEAYGVQPEAARYKPVNFNGVQRAAIIGNQEVLPDIKNLVSGTNKFINQDALNRVMKLVPGYSDSMAKYGDATNRLIGGDLPFDDVNGIVGNRGEMSGALGVPGGAVHATLKDLGIGKMDAMRTGGGMLQDMVRIAEMVSPRGSNMNAQNLMITPQSRIDMEMKQHQLEQQSDQDFYDIKAGGDPGARALLETQFGQLGGVGREERANAALGQQLGGLLTTGVTAYLGQQGGGASANAAGGFDTAGGAVKGAPYAAGYSNYGGSTGWVPRAATTGRTWNGTGWN